MNSSHPCLSCFKSCRNVRVLTTCSTFSRKVTGGVGGGVLGLLFAGYVPPASQSPYPIIVYCLANYRPHFSNFLENVIFAIPT